MLAAQGTAEMNGAGRLGLRGWVVRAVAQVMAAAAMATVAMVAAVMAAEAMAAVTVTVDVELVKMVWVSRAKVMAEAPVQALQLAGRWPVLACCGHRTSPRASAHCQALDSNQRWHYS